MTEENQEVIEEVVQDDMAAIAAEIEAEYSGEAPEEGAVPIVEAESADAEAEEVEESEGDGQVEDEVIEATTQEDTNRSKTIPRERFDKVNESKKAAEDRAAKLEAELEEYKAVLREKLDAKQKEAEPEDEFDPLDPEADAKYKKEIEDLRQEIKGTSFVNAIKAENAAYGAANPQEWKDKQDAVLADIAISHLNDAADMGESLTEKQAFKKAQEELATKMYTLYEKGKSMGAYIDARAKSVAKKYAQPKKKEATRQKGVDVVELDNLRNSAGASTNKTIGARTKGGDSLDALYAEATAEWQKESFSQWLVFV